MFHIFLLLLILLANLNPIQGCNSKKLKTGTVCVCDLDSCDEISPLDVTMGQAALYTTSESGDRLNRQVVYATDNEPFGTLHVTINSSLKYQEIIGFGSTFSDAAGANLKSLPDALANLILRQYFSSDGLNYQFGRVPIASNDFSTRVYSYNDISEDYEMQNFNLTLEDQKWKIPYLKLAQNYSNNELKLLAVPWSAPGWLKTTNSMEGYGELKGKAGDTYHKAYAKYLTKFVEAYKSIGLPIWALSTQNAPTNGSNKKSKIQSTLFTADSQKEFIKSDLGPALKASDSGKTVKLLILDDNRNNLPKWADSVLKDAEAASFISGIAVHAYADSSSDNHLDKTHKNHPDFFLLGTEASEGASGKGEGPILGSWDRAESYATDIIDDMNNWLIGWIDRNLVLDVEGGPNWALDFADAPIIALPNFAQIYKQPAWYAIAHFSRFVKPGAIRIDSSIGGIIEPHVKATAFLNPDGSKVVVMVNIGGIESHTIVLNDKANAINNYQFQLPTHSIITLYIQN